PRHPRPALAADFTVVGLQLARKQAQQGGLAGAVAADERDALAGFDREVDAFEQERAADAVVDGVEGDQGHAHILPVRAAGARAQELQDSIEQPARSSAQSGRSAAKASRPGCPRYGSRSTSSSSPIPAPSPTSARSIACCAR